MTPAAGGASSRPRRAMPAAATRRDAIAAGVARAGPADAMHRAPGRVICLAPYPPDRMNSVMPRGQSLLRLLLALVLCLQSSLAAAHCLRLATAPQHTAFHVEICTADGIVVMDLGGAADHQMPSGHEHSGFCVACHGLPQAVLPEPPAVPIPAERPVATRHAAPEAAPPLGARAPPYISRAPPAFS